MPHKRTSDSLSEHASDPERVGKFDERVVVTTFVHLDPKRAFSHEFDTIEWPGLVCRHLRFALVLSPRSPSR